MSSQTVPMMLPPDLTIAELVERNVFLNNDFYEAITQVFAAPAVAASVVIPVADSTRYAVGLYLYISGFGIVYVDSLPSATSISIRNVDMTPAVTVPVTTPIFTCAPPFDPSTLSDIPGIYDTLAQTFVAPVAGGTRDLYVTLGGWFIVGMSVYIQDLGWYTIISVAPGDLTHCVVQYDNTTISLGVRNRTSDSMPATTTAVFPCPLPQFTPDETTLNATNAANRPGRALMKIDDAIMASMVRHLDVTNPRMASDTQIVTLTTGAQEHDVGAAVVFDTAFSTDIPQVVITPHSDLTLGVDTDVSGLVFYVGDVTLLGFNIYYTKPAADPDDLTIEFDWIAIGT